MASRPLGESRLFGSQSIPLFVDAVVSIGLLERHCLTRQHIARPPTIVFLAIVDGGFDETRNTLVDRLQAILAKDAHLSSCLTGTKTPKPAFASSSNPLSANDIVVRGNTDNLPVQDDGHTRASRILEIELRSLDGINLEHDPLLRVAIYPYSVDEGAPSCQVALSTGNVSATLHFKLTLTTAVHHILADGMGAAGLFEALLSTSPLPATFLGPDCIPRPQDPKSLKPPLSFVLPLVFRELWLPKMPKFVGKIFPGKKPAWPLKEDIVKKPSESDGSLGVKILMFADEQTIPALKHAAGRTCVQTVNSLVHAAALVALYTALQKDQHHSECIVLKSDTPISFRDPEKQGHGLWSGNCIGMVRCQSYEAQGQCS